MDRRYPSPYIFPMLSMSSSSLGSRNARGSANASSCRLQVSLYCTVLCHIVSLQYLSMLSLHRLAGLPCRMVSTWWHAMCIGRLGGCWCALPRTLSFVSHIADYIYAFVEVCPLFLTQTLIFLSLYIMLRIHLSIMGRAIASLFCACFVSVQMFALCQSWQHTCVMCTHVFSGRSQCCIWRYIEYLILVLAYAVQPAIIRRCIGHILFFSWLLLVKL